MRLYIAGPMTGLPENNYPAFHDAETALQGVGYDTLNPASNQPVLAMPDSKPTWQDFMRMSLHQVADADGIALLPGWQNSKGARLEAVIAKELGLPIHSVAAWIEDAKVGMP